MIDDIFTEDGTGAMYHISWSSNGDPFSRRSRLLRATSPGTSATRSSRRSSTPPRTTTDPAEREQVVADLQAHLWDQMWHVPLYNSDFTIAHSDELSGPRRPTELPDVTSIRRASTE